MTSATFPLNINTDVKNLQIDKKGKKLLAQQILWIHFESFVPIISAFCFIHHVNVCVEKFFDFNFFMAFLKSLKLCLHTLQRCALSFIFDKESHQTDHSIFCLPFKDDHWKTVTSVYSFFRTFLLIVHNLKFPLMEFSALECIFQIQCGNHNLTMLDSVSFKRYTLFWTHS